MDRLMNFAKTFGVIALLTLILVSMTTAVSRASTANNSSEQESAATTIDCEGPPQTCFIRVNDDGSIIFYDLGRRLN